MKYRPAKNSDAEGIRKLCEQEKLAFPLVELCFVAEEDGEIIGFVNIANMPILDTMICKNGVSAVRLFDMAIGALSVTGKPYLKCFTKRPSVVSVAERSGFIVNDTSMTILTKEI